jgi:hypothetical protein
MNTGVGREEAALNVSIFTMHGTVLSMASVWVMNTKCEIPCLTVFPMKLYLTVSISFVPCQEEMWE